MAQRIFASFRRPQKYPPVRPYFKKRTLHKNEMLRSRRAKTPNAIRNRYRTRCPTRNRTRSGPGNPPNFHRSYWPSARPSVQTRAKYVPVEARHFKATKKSHREPGGQPDEQSQWRVGRAYARSTRHGRSEANSWSFVLASCVVALARARTGRFFFRRLAGWCMSHVHVH